MRALQDIRFEWLYPPTPIHVVTAGRYTDIPVIALDSSRNFSSFSWGTANLARYMPIFIPSSFVVARFLSPNNNTTGNVDMGIYDSAGQRLLSSGSTARTSGCQYIDVANRTFPAGAYYLGMVCSSNTSSIFAITNFFGFEGPLCGALQEALGATTLPSTMTPVASTLTSAIPLWGFTQSDTL